MNNIIYDDNNFLKKIFSENGARYQKKCIFAAEFSKRK